MRMDALQRLKPVASWLSGPGRFSCGTSWFTFSYGARSVRLRGHEQLTELLDLIYEIEGVKRGSYGNTRTIAGQSVCFTKTPWKFTTGRGEHIDCDFFIGELKAWLEMVLGEQQADGEDEFLLAARDLDSINIQIIKARDGSQLKQLQLSPKSARELVVAIMETLDDPDGDLRIITDSQRRGYLELHPFSGRGRLDIGLVNIQYGRYHCRCSCARLAFLAAEIDTMLGGLYGTT